MRPGAISFGLTEDDEKKLKEKYDSMDTVMSNKRQSFMGEIDKRSFFDYLGCVFPLPVFLISTILVLCPFFTLSPQSIARKAALQQNSNEAIVKTNWSIYLNY
jgi:Na+/H+ antiporter NhaD/arsenite permease-like protein